MAHDSAEMSGSSPTTKAQYSRLSGIDYAATAGFGTACSPAKQNFTQEYCCSDANMKIYPYYDLLRRKVVTFFAGDEGLLFPGGTARHDIRFQGWDVDSRVNVSQMKIRAIPRSE